MSSVSSSGGASVSGGASGGGGGGASASGGGGGGGASASSGGGGGGACACGNTISHDDISTLCEGDDYPSLTMLIDHHPDKCFVGWMCLICWEFNPIPNLSHGCEHKCGMGDDWCPDISKRMTKMGGDPIEILKLLVEIERLRKEVAEAKAATANAKKKLEEQIEGCREYH